MTRLPSLGYEKVIRALQRDGWVIIRQRGSHIRLHKHTRTEVLKLTVPAHTLSSDLHLVTFLNKRGLPKRSLNRCFKTDEGSRGEIHALADLIVGVFFKMTLSRCNQPSFRCGTHA